MIQPDIQTHTFFTFFNAGQAERLVKQTHIRSYDRGDILFREGDLPDAVYLVLEGRISIEKNVPNNDSRIVILEARPDDCIGEFGIIDGKPRNATAVISSPAAAIGVLAYDTIYPVLHEPQQHQANLRLFSHILDKVRRNNLDYVEQLVRQTRMAALGQMSGAIVHDLRNPLAIIQIAAEILQRSIPEAQHNREYCESIILQVKRIAHMTDDVLDFAKGVALQLNRTSFPVREFFEQFVLQNKVYLDKYEVTLSIDCEDQTLYADRERLGRVLQNLINNSIDAFAGKPGQISILARAESDRSVIIVGDNGSGIPANVLSTLFDPFVTQGKKGGTGLGMAISRSIIEAHGGTITAENMPEHGCAFTMILPCNKP